MVFMLAADHRPSVKEAFDLLVEALHQRHVVDEKMKQSQRISEGLQQDRELYADLACKYDLRLAKIPHALCPFTYTQLGSLHNSATAVVAAKDHP